MSVPNYQGVVEELRGQYPQEWAAAHRGGPLTEAFVRRLAWVLHQRDPKVGLNGKRGNPGDLSDDVVCYREPGQSRDARTGESVTVIDFIIGAGGPDPRPGWGEVWDPDNMPTPATWVQPFPVDDTVPQPVPPQPPTPQPQPGPCRFNPADWAGIQQQLENLGAHLAQQGADAQATREQLRDELAQVRAQLDDLINRLQAMQFTGSIGLPGWLGGSRPINLEQPK